MSRVRQKEKQIALTNLQQEMQQTLVGNKLVFGEGSLDSKMTIVGEAPGRTEEIEGHPFTGPAGKILDQLLEESSMNRCDIWITNAVKWRPVKSGTKFSTRTPTAREIQLSFVWLKKELEIISPKIILCLGNISARALIKKGFTINKDHGQWFRSLIGPLALATFHPAYVLRQGRKEQKQIIRKMHDDLNRVRYLFEFYQLK